MPGSRRYFTPSRKAFHCTVKGRLYGASESRSRPVGVLTRCDGKRRYPFAESVLDDERAPQCGVHDCIVDVVEESGTSSYVVFFWIDDGEFSRFNRPASYVTPWPMYGDALVMRLSKSKKFVVNMRHGDAVMADEVLERVAIAFNEHQGELCPVYPASLRLHRKKMRSWRQLMEAKKAWDRRQGC
ncbi:uncharacterized protein BXZ73DRAFT_99313 [Epithele typhae]|uniref:uncharacterized protein n=1 Tax=Epithele typhae TaxID=378194 RepID=UPI002007DAAA|nr:uncharacterized protein BXZ73DRAFT_99313 [Epithele typhae]KAH9939690.1 hypothetical protein BXZ73DRAFT_99313 [Epithele typhae]